MLFQAIPQRLRLRADEKQLWKSIREYIESKTCLGRKSLLKGDVPPARHSTSAALISDGQYAMMFGGCHDSKAFNDTWLLSTGFWIAFFFL